MLLAGLGSNCSWELIFLKPECEVCVSGLVYVVFFFFFFFICLAREKCNKQRVECGDVQRLGWC